MKIIKKIILTISILICYGYAQTYKGIVLDSSTGEPIIGATVYWVGTSYGAQTDVNGAFSVIKPPNVDLLSIRFIGYAPDTLHLHDKNLTELIIKLNPSTELNVVEINARQSGIIVKQYDPFLVETMTEKEFRKAACCNLGESFTTSATVDVSFSDAVTGAKHIQMLGLSGHYIQLTTELLPSIRGLAAPFGLNYIAGSWMESVQLTKGAGSVVNGYEAMAGQINVELKKPFNTDRFYINLYGNHMGRMEANIHWSARMGKKWSTLTLLNGSFFDNKLDHNKDQFIDMPLIKSGTMVHRWHFQNDKFETQFGIKGLVEKRTSGTLAFFQNDTAFPRYGIDMLTYRGEAFFKMGFFFKQEWKSLGIQSNFTYHHQDGFIGNNIYKAEQKTGYLNVIYQSIIGNTFHKFRTGGSFLIDEINQEYSTYKIPRLEIVPGAYFEYTYENYKKTFTLVAGGRADYNNLFGFQPIPRLNVRYEPVKNLILRASGGRAWRTPNLFADNFSMLVSSRNLTISPELKPEESWNYGASIQYTIEFKKDLRAVFIADFFRTDFTNQLIVDREAETDIRFYNLNGPSFSNVFQFNFTIEPIEQFEIRLAYKFQDVKTTYDGGQLLSVPLVPMHRILFNTSYTTPKFGFTFDFTTQVTGNSRMPTINDPGFIHYQGVTPWYVILNAQITKDFKKRLQLYVGVENITNYVQHSPLVDAANPFGTKFDATMIFAPIFGRMVYFGVHYNIPYKTKKKL